ncbi:MAG TPA: hypothetical protein VNK05_15380 [Chloroflexota bacterium]|jgi:hypothetical protein|nr:hypothetical protein [Chloroflexota bacterium]
MSNAPQTAPLAGQPSRPGVDPAAPPAGSQIALQIAVIEATARIVSGAQSSHLIQDPDIAQGVAASFRTIYDAIMGAVGGAPAPNPETRAGLTAG